MWKLYLTDLYGNMLGPLLNAHERKISKILMGIPSISGRLRLDHPRADDLLTQDTLVLAKRGNTVALNGPVISAEEVGNSEGQTMAFVASGPMWRLQKRIIGKSKAGFAYGTGANLIDRSEIARRILQEVNAEAYTGISQGTITASSLGAIGPDHFKPAGEIITELGASLNGGEFDIRPTEAVLGLPGSGGWPQLGIMDIKPVIGTERANAVFRYGGDASTHRPNVEEYTRKRDLEGVANKAWHIPPGFPDGTLRPILNKSDAASITARGLYEAVVEGDITTDSIRNALLDQHILIRKAHREVITFKPIKNAIPAPIQDYDIGDQVRCIAFAGKKKRFDAMFRIWGIQVDLDSMGNEETTLELIRS